MLPQDDLTISTSDNLHGLVLFDFQLLSDFPWDNDFAKIIQASYNSCCPHFSFLLLANIWISSEPKIQMPLISFYDS